MAMALACVLARMSLHMPHCQLNATHLQRANLGEEFGLVTMQVMVVNFSLYFSQTNQSSYQLKYKISLNSFLEDTASNPMVSQTTAGTQHHPHLMKKLSTLR